MYKKPPQTSTSISIRSRAGSVERSSFGVGSSTSTYSGRASGSSERSPAPYRTSYGTERGRSTEISSTRMSRATSYDPFASKSSSSSVRSGSVIRSSPLSSSDYSSSYKMSSLANRYSSSEQLNSYKPSSYRSSTVTPSSYTPRNVRAGSVSYGAYDSPRSTIFDSTSLSRYRPPETPSYTSSLSKYRSTDLSSTSDYSSLKYSSRNNSDNSYTSSRSTYSSPLTSAYSSRNTTSSSFKSDRDYKSMSRNDSEEDDDIEATFKKLYRKYVTESEPDLTKTDKDEAIVKKFDTSKSEAEDSDFSISEDDILQKYEKKGLRRASSTSSITPRASECNTPSTDMTPKCSPLPARKIIINKDNLSTSSESSPEPTEPPKIKSIPKIAETTATPEPIRKVIGTSIKINGRKLNNDEDLKIGGRTTENANSSSQQPVRITIKRNVETESNKKMVPPVEGNLIAAATSQLIENSEKAEKQQEEREKSSSVESENTKAIHRRVRRDPNRTLENLKNSLMSEKDKVKDSSPAPAPEEPPAQKSPEPAPSSEPPAPASDVKVRKIPIPLVLITEPSNPSTPLATTPVNTAASICLWNKRESTTSEEEEDEEEFEDEEEYSSGDWTEGEDEEVYGSDYEFCVSQTFSLKDHIPLGDLYPLATSSSTSSARVSEFDGADTFLAESRKEESRGRVDSLFAMPAPTFTCSVSYDGMTPNEEDDEWGSDEVHSCEEGDDEDFRVLPIARPGSSSMGAYMSPGSMTSDEDYDGGTVGCTLKLVDKMARKDSEESEESEYYDDEEEYEDEDEEYWDEEYEYDEEEEEEGEIEEYEDEEVEEDELSAADVTMKSVETSESDEEMSVSEIDEMITSLPEIRSMTESLVEELMEEAVYSELPEEQILALDGIEVEDYTGTKAVHIVPTFVRQMTEDIKEEMTSRFSSDRKPATDFAKKAVIQATKLEKVKVGESVKTEVGEPPKKKIEVAPPKDEPKLEVDKSAARKSALNMKEEDARKKAAADEKAAAQKARRLGTVSAISEKFKDPETVEKPAALYKKSTRLQQKTEEKPKRKYEVIKPVINDDFDKQMAEIRQQMKTGSSELQTKMKDLSKGILTVTEEVKTREMEEKRRLTSEKASGAFGKAEVEKARWKAARDAETQLEYAKIEAEKHLKKKRLLIDKPDGQAVLAPEVKAEPKRTIRRWKPPPPDPNAIIPSFSSGPKEPRPTEAPKPKPSSKPGTPVAKRKSPIIMDKGSKAEQAVSSIASSPLKSDGAVATKIRNQAISSSSPTSDHPNPRRYNSRRKTQEIVNESVVKPRMKHRKTAARRRRYILSDHDVDSILGYKNYTTFDQFERFFDDSSRLKWAYKPAGRKIRRAPASRIFISDLTDIDKIYKSSEIRDIIASVNMVY